MVLEEKSSWKRNSGSSTGETSAISALGPSNRQAAQVLLASILLKAGQRDSPPLPHA